MDMVTVYRKKIEGMIFDFDEEEYFDDFSPSEGDCIYCPKGHTHSLMNSSEEGNLTFLAVVPKQ